MQSPASSSQQTYAAKCMHSLKAFAWAYRRSTSLPFLGHLYSAGCHLYRPPASVHTASRKSLATHAAAATALESTDAADNIAAQGSDNNGSSGRNRKQRRKQRQLDAGMDPQQDIAENQFTHLESLRLLEWPEVCQQVASFSATAVAAERALAAKLPMATSQQQAELLLQETAEAQDANLALKGIHDLRGLLAAVGRDRVLQPVHLDGVASSLEIAAAVAERLQEKQGDEARFPALLNLGRGINQALPTLRHSIRHCIEDGRIMDRASERLGRVRAQRRDNMQSLRQGMNEWARKLAAQNVSEEALVVIRRDRLCVPVKAGRQSQLPKGSVTLATSASGSTVYMEPEPVVALNNCEAMLRAQEHEEEDSILAELSSMVKGSTMSLQRLMKAVSALDIASARARHAAWLNGSKPTFISEAEALETGCMHALGVYHPLLLEPSLPPLKDPPATEAVNYDAAASPSSSAAADSMGRASWEPQQPPRQTYGNRGQPKGKVPCPVDLLVPAGVKVVAVTGPNTGGKTASLKALGLTAVMAKAGLFISTAKIHSNQTLSPQQAQRPSEHQQQTEQQHQHHQQAEQQKQQQPRLVFFDKVLADVGDSQNLQQSLSTFSGHIKRVRSILEEATPHSLVLLDEVGSGTDPGEGAALAGALLDRLAHTAGLTYATTHHAQLKERPASDARFINASVEFDLATLRPTYRLLWREAGLSNALAVAEGLGFDPKVVQRARQIATHGQEHSNPSTKAEDLKRSLQQELEDAQQEAAAAAAERESAERELSQLQVQAEQLAQQQAALKDSDAQLRSAVQTAKSDLDWVIAEVKAGKLTHEEADECIKSVSDSALSVTAALAAVKQAESGGLEDVRDQESAGLRESGWFPTVDESVRLLRLGGKTGKVLKVGADGALTVKMGPLSMQTTVADVAPVTRSKASRAAAATGKLPQKKSTAQQSSQGSSAAPANPGRALLTFQTDQNTVDVRGQRSDEALSQVEAGLNSVATGSALFVVHGVGSGKLRTDIHELLQQSFQVAKFSLEKESSGGCTVVYLK